MGFVCVGICGDVDVRVVVYGVLNWVVFDDVG